ncbi:hypothetical protein LXL04_027731 [Taraxacum kok-saghyz]
MATVFLCCTTRPVPSIKLGFHQIPSSPAASSSPNLHLTSIFRFTNVAKLVTKRRLTLVNALPSEEPIKKKEAITNSDTGNAQGPPFLTILAGIIVFALLLWVIGSIVSWVFGLFKWVMKTLKIIRVNDIKEFQLFKMCKDIKLKKRPYYQKPEIIVFFKMLNTIVKMYSQKVCEQKAEEK